MTDTRFHDLLHRYWGYDDFRGIQLDIIESIASGHDTLGLMPTGGGKSITFQVPALAMAGMTIVVTPLIALMKDQVENLRRRGIRAAAIHAGLSHDDILRHLDNAIFGAYKLLYVSPERLSTELFRTKVRRMHVSFITVDEAHCISQWGYDFRPSYLGIAKVRQLLPGVPVLALTATATPAVIDDICDRLEFPATGRAVFRMSFARKNLSYIVRHTDNKQAELLYVLRRVKGSAIVYTRSRKGTAEVARALREEGLTAINYHAGLTDADKDVRQQAWQEDKVRVIVATNAFGMGIDKPDVRLVVHMDLPDSVEAYFQEAGRAGRDGQKAYAVLLYDKGDHAKMMRRIPETFPEKDYIADVYNKLAYFFELAVGDGYQATYEFNLEKFCVNFRLFPVPVVSALNILTRAGYIDYREKEESTSRLLFLTARDELYRLRHLQPEADAVVRALLRIYGGMFSDYICIDESRLAEACGLAQDAIYKTLKWLSRIRIVHYIPRKCVPHITYTMSRVERPTLTREVYELRRDDYVKRVSAILDYATSTGVCRSRILLDYFGERSADCGRCDVCVEKKKADAGTEAICQRLLDRLSDGEERDPAALCLPDVDPHRCAEALERLVSEGRVRFADGYYRKA